MNIKILVDKVKKNKQLTFSFLWLLFIAFQWDIFFGMLGDIKDKLLNDKGLMPLLAIIEYILLSICIIAPIVAVNIGALFCGEPRLGIPFRILSVKYNILIPYAAKNITLIILNCMKTMLMFSTILAGIGLFNLMDPVEPFGQLAERLAYDLTSMAQCKMLLSYFIDRAHPLCSIIATLPFACIGSVLIITNMVFLTISALPLPSLLVIAFSLYTIFRPPIIAPKE